MKKESRWLKSAIAASKEPLPAFPWQRQSRHRPEAMKSTTTPLKAMSIAAR